MMEKQYQLKISLKGIRPTIWRRILVPSGISFLSLHNIIQVAFGWGNAQLFSFAFKDEEIQADYWDMGWSSDSSVLPASTTLIDDCLLQEKKCEYEYGIGDGWLHQIVLEKVLDVDPEQMCPACTAGKRRAPIEKMGGVSGYADFEEALNNPDYPGRGDLIEWVMGDPDDTWDFEYFNLEEVNESLHTFVDLEDEDEYEDEDEDWDTGVEMRDERPPFQEPSMESWKALLEVAVRIKAKAPWEFLKGEDLIFLQDPETAEPIIVSTMGQMKECFGVVAYIGTSGVQSYMEIMSSVGGEYSGMLNTQDGIAFYLGDRMDLNDAERKKLRELGYRFRGKNQWIFFRAVKPGFFPWFLDAAQTKQMTWVLEQVEQSILDYCDGIVKPDFERGEVLFRIEDAQTKKWTSVAMPFPNIKVMHEVIQITDEITVARLRRQPQKETDLLVGSYYLPIPIETQNGNAPTLASVFMLMDTQTGLLVGQKTWQDLPENYAQHVLRALIEYIDRCGRPRKLCLHGGELLYNVQDLCDQIGIQVVTNCSMQAIDRAFMTIMEMVGAGMD